MRARPHLTLAAAIGLALTACAPQRQETRTPVPEGINDAFLAKEIDVDEFVARWELESREVYVARHDIVAAMQVEAGDTVADIGAGTGLFTSLLSEAVGDEGRVIAVDISEAFVARVADRAEREGLTNVETRVSNERSAELPAGEVDVAFLCDVYHHFEYHEDMLRSIRRALKPGGRLVVVDFERIPGVTREFLMGHVRAGKDVVRAEVIGAGFELVEEVDVAAFRENYFLRFQR